MKILHLLSQLEITGAEAYAIWLAESQINESHDVYIISDKLHIPTRAYYRAQPIANRSYIQRWRNAFFLRKFVREHEIDVVHAHSRAASWVAYAGLMGLRKRPAFISTIHGRQHLHKTPRKRDVYGDQVISICENVATHLRNEMGIPAEKINIVRNGFLADDLEASLRSKTATRTKAMTTLSIIGRNSGPKGERLNDLLKTVFPRLLAEFPNLMIRIGGGPVLSFSEKMLTQIQLLNRQFSRRIQVDGQMSYSLLIRVLADSDIVIGSGRLAMNSILIGTPTLALGEAMQHGFVTEKNLQECLCSNFGDISASVQTPSMNYDEIYATLKAELAANNIKPLSPKLIQTVETEFSGKRNAASIFGIYERAIAKLAHPRHIPVLMYHKITDSPLETKHKIYVTKERFADQMEQLKKDGYQPITFKNYQDFRSGLRSWDEFPEKPIFLTFDDAYEDNYHNALPVLQKYSWKATVFALGDPTLRQNRWDTDTDPSEPSAVLMDDGQLKEFINSGHEIGAHSLSHRDLTTLSSDESAREIAESKKLLEQRLGSEVISFAYPYGKYNEEIKRQVMAQDFKFAVATDTGGLHLEEDPYAIFRASIFPQDEANRIRKKSSPWYRRYYKIKRGK